MKEILIFLTIVLISTCFFLSCSKDDSQTLSIDKTELIFTSGSASREFTITADGEWDITAEGLQTYYGPNMGEADWYSVEPVFGNGNAKVTVISKERTKGNTATLKIKYDGKEKLVQLRQDASE